MTTIATLPAAPNKATDSAASFSSKADTFVAALGGFVSQTNAVAGEVNVAAAAAAADAIDTAASAATALAAPGTNATSVSAMTPATGPKSFTLAQVGKSFVVGMAVMVAETANPAGNWMHGIITAFTAASGAITVEVGLICAVPASAAAWTVSISGPAVSGLGVGQAWQEPARAGNTIYQNTTGRSIEVKIQIITSAGTLGSGTLQVGAASPPATFVDSYNPAAVNGPDRWMSAIIPNNHYYKLLLTGGMGVVAWRELR